MLFFQPIYKYIFRNNKLFFFRLEGLDSIMDSLDFDQVECLIQAADKALEKKAKTIEEKDVAEER